MLPGFKDSYTRKKLTQKLASAQQGNIPSVQVSFIPIAYTNRAQNQGMTAQDRYTSSPVLPGLRSGGVCILLPLYGEQRHWIVVGTGRLQLVITAKNAWAWLLAPSPN